MAKLPAARRLALALATAALAFGALAGVSGAGATPASERIIAGTTADPADWPFAAALFVRYRGREVLDCGAAIIAPRYALTAAHCAVGVRPSDFSVVVGRPNLALKGPGAEIRVRKVKVNPDYGPPTFRADTAILVLRHRTAVEPVALPTIAQSDALTTPGSELRVAGWGATRPNGSHTSRRLRTTVETALRPAPCKRTYGRIFSQSTTVCTQARKLDPPAHGHAGACYGDSGGPLVGPGPSGPLLIGAVSGGGLRCGTSPDYYARISANLRFIRRVSGVTP